MLPRPCASGFEYAGGASGGTVPSCTFDIVGRCEFAGQFRISHNAQHSICGEVARKVNCHN